MTPHARLASDKVQDQLPSPPGDAANASAVEAEVELALQREVPDSARANTVVTLGQIVADWVMEPEVHDPAKDEFLHWPTRTAFVDDLLQVRVQLNGHELTVDAWVEIVVRSGPTVLLTLTTSDPPPPGQLDRPLKISATLGTLTETDTDGAIHVETQPGAPRSLLATTVKLPDWPDSDKAADGSTTVQAEVRVAARYVSYQAELPPLRVVRWWAAPARNIDAVRTPATGIDPLIDGEEFFARANALISAAGPGHTLFLASWSFFCLTAIVGGAAGPAPLAAVAPPVVPANLANTIIRALCDAAARGAEVRILLDNHNSGWATSSAELVLARFPAPTRVRVLIRRADHPTKLVVGAGPLKTERQNGSYHEKYLCLTGNGAWKALIGGIDLEPDRVNPYRHGWRQDAAVYNAALVAAYTGYGEDWHGQYNPLGGPQLFGDPFTLWHDIGVFIEGQYPVQFLADDFTRRWNAGVRLGRPAADLPAIPYAIPPKGSERVQLVKTDVLAGTPVHARAVTAGIYPGTRDAWECAIRQARHYIYIENQYLRDTALRQAIVDRLAANTILQVIVVVPFRAEETRTAGAAPTYDTSTMAGLAWDFIAGDAAQRNRVQAQIQRGMNYHGEWLQAEFINALRAAAASRVLVCSLAKFVVPQAEEIYPHAAKIMIVDDTWAYIGSANANGRSLIRDAESGYVIHDRAKVTAFRRRLWQEHLNVTWTTRDIRDFRARFDALTPGPKPKITDYTAADVGAVQAVKHGVPPAGFQYSGPGSYLRASHAPVGARRSRRNGLALQGERQRRDDRTRIGASLQRCQPLWCEPA